MQEMEGVSSASAMLDKLLSWPHVLDIFTTIQAEDERQIMQALQQLKMFSSNPKQGDIWKAAESARTVLSSFSRPLSTGAMDQRLSSALLVPRCQLSVSTVLLTRVFDCFVSLCCSVLKCQRACGCGEGICSTEGGAQAHEQAVQPARQGTAATAAANIQ